MREQVVRRPRGKNQPQGPTTKWKEEGIAGGLWVSLSLADVFPQWPFWYVDMNCGCGRNHEFHCDGSPMCALELLEETFRRRYVAFFCDKDPELVNELKGRYEKRGWPSKGNKIILRCMDNKYLLPEVAQAIRASGENPRYAVGAVLSDPKGPGKASGFPLDELARFHPVHCRMDSILNVNCGALARCSGLLNSSKDFSDQPHIGSWQETTKDRPSAMSLGEIMDAVDPTRSWLLRNPVKGDPQRFCLVIGREQKGSSWKKLHFFRRESEVGKLIEQTMAHVPGQEVVKPPRKSRLDLLD